MPLCACVCPYAYAYVQVKTIGTLEPLGGGVGGGNGFRLTSKAFIETLRKGGDSPQFSLNTLKFFLLRSTFPAY